MGENPQSGSGLHSFLTSSHSHRWAETEVSIHDIHGVFKRPQLSAFEMTREVIARAPPPAFLFPNQQCQRPRAEAPRTASRQNHPFTPDVGGGGYLSNLEFRVKPFLHKTFQPNHQTNQMANPTIRSALLKNSANPVKKKTSRSLPDQSRMNQRILANP
jgi:hypothetical protein